MRRRGPAKRGHRIDRELQSCARAMVRARILDGTDGALKVLADAAGGRRIAVWLPRAAVGFLERKGNLCVLDLPWRLAREKGLVA